MTSTSLEGPLSKWTNVMKGWQYRWFVLDDGSGLLSYYTSKEKMKKGARRGCVRLRNAIIGIDDEDDAGFTITVDHKVFHFQARDEEERTKWATSLEDTIRRHSQHNFDKSNKIDFNNFDKQLAEADAYLQIMLTSVNSLQIKMDALGPGAEKANIAEIIKTSRLMMESVKKTIVMLQLAKRSVSKSTSHKENSPIVQSDQHVVQAEESVAHLSISSTTSSVISGENTLNGNNVGAGEEFKTPEKLVNPQQPPVASSGVPLFSYSSTDDENDDFEDAYDEVQPSQQELLPSGKNPSPSQSATHGDTSGGDKKDAPSDISLAKVSSKDFFMNEEEGNGSSNGNVDEGNKSVIMHLLTQLKIGMDLTKITLPTFILERRSLLEMYADFFSHPDLFIDVAKQQTPEKRMVAALKFYLSTFSAGRDSSIAKKPYNPILGETFKCLYNISGEEMTYDDAEKSDGPVPWAKSDHLAFLAEQVSHHPPVSAFYAEHKESQIQFNGHIWTKSKFLGMSVGVHNIGQGVIRLLDSGEEYIINFPNGYGRSILTVPWVELGGDCQITCAKSGYRSDVKFHTKPFYGGRAHKISGEVFSPNQKKSVYSFEGDWNGKINIKTQSTGKSELLFDANTCDKFPKFVQAVPNQLPTESRRMWKKVTEGLAANNIDFATENKRFLEDRQRKDAKDRVEAGVVYKPALFTLDNDQNWVYNSLLSNRS